MRASWFYVVGITLVSAVCFVICAAAESNAQLVRSAASVGAPEDAAVEAIPIAPRTLRNYPWSRRADALCSIYANPVRDDWFRRNYSARARQQLIPIQEADWCNERVFTAGPKNRGRELLCVSRQAPVKNLDLLARALRVYARKYRPIRMSLVGGFNTSWKALEGEPRYVMSQVENELGRCEDYLDLVDFMHPLELSAYYRDHKLLVFASLIEGKNRALHEAMASDTPIVLCEAFNHMTRGTCPAVPEGAGLLAPFDAEGFADCMHHALDNWADFRARDAYLAGFSGRTHTFDRCLRSLNEYARVPGFEGCPPHENPKRHALQMSFTAYQKGWKHASVRAAGGSRAASVSA
jgi:glycosyltransferase involved in cell wall biosynthesis